MYQESNEIIQTRQQMISERQKSAAQMLLNADYPENIKNEMQTAFAQEKYDVVQSIASNHDIKQRESLDAKITMYPNPNFKEAPDIEQINDEIKNKFLEIISDRTSYLLEHNQAVQLKQSELDSMPLHEIEDPNPRFLFKAEGIDQEFDSAYKAIRAYKDKNGIRQPKPGKHSFRKTLVYTDNSSASVSDRSEIMKNEESNEDLCHRVNDEKSMGTDQANT